MRVTSKRQLEILSKYADLAGDLVSLPSCAVDHSVLPDRHVICMARAIVERQPLITESYWDHEVAFSHRHRLPVGRDSRAVPRRRCRSWKASRPANRGDAASRRHDDRVTVARHRRHDSVPTRVQSPVLESNRRRFRDSTPASVHTGQTAQLRLVSPESQS